MVLPPPPAPALVVRSSPPATERQYLPAPSFTPEIVARPIVTNRRIAKAGKEPPPFRRQDPSRVDEPVRLPTPSPSASPDQSSSKLPVVPLPPRPLATMSTPTTAPSSADWENETTQERTRLGSENRRRAERENNQKRVDEASMRARLASEAWDKAAAELRTEEERLRSAKAKSKSLGQGEMPSIWDQQRVNELELERMKIGRGNQRGLERIVREKILAAERARDIRLEEAEAQRVQSL